jgi:hypothetical protein
MSRPPAATPVALGPTSALPSRTFSEYAEARMWDLLKDYGNQVGNKYTGERAGKTGTDCITYVMNVLTYAFEQTGKPDAAAGVRRNSDKGHKLAQFLTGLGWSAYFWTPDSRNPRDGQSEHVVAYKKAVSVKAYYTVPVTGLIVDYNLTPGSKLARVADTAAFEKFSKVKFAYGLARGGYHTFLLSYGMVFEVHWDRIGPGLYERSPFFSYSWLSGLVVTPHDSGFSL